MGNNPDGRNINLKCGAMHPEIVAAAVRKHKAHAGIALDGDADRVIFADEKGEVIDGDHLMAICALDLKARKQLRKNTVVATVMSNMGFEIAMKQAASGSSGRRWGTATSWSACGRRDTTWAASSRGTSSSWTTRRRATGSSRPCRSSP